ncbi:MAG: hypothetical protein E7666_04765 [Ruminococcaceae bacterium]|nr:hypothetical protein [Oscillospiraceae bacterium]
MTITHICDKLRALLFHTGFSYGFVANGVIYKPDGDGGFDANFDRLLKTQYRVQAPSLTRRERIGTCIDAVLLMRDLLTCEGVGSKIWLLHHLEKNKAHTILTFSAEQKTVYLELTPQFSKPWYGKEIVYENELELVRAYESNGYAVLDVTDSVRVGEPPTFLLSRLRGSVF